MKTDLLAKVAHRDHVDTDAATSRYVALLWGQKADDDTAAELHGILPKIGKSVQDAYDDLAALERARELLKLIEASRGVEAKLEEVAKLFEALDAEKAAWLAAADERRRVIVGKNFELLNLQGNAEQAARALASLKLKSGAILGPLTVPDHEAVGADRSAPARPKVPPLRDGAESSAKKVVAAAGT